MNDESNDSLKKRSINTKSEEDDIKINNKNNNMDEEIDIKTQNKLDRIKTMKVAEYLRIVAMLIGFVILTVLYIYWREKYAYVDIPSQITPTGSVIVINKKKALALEIEQFIILGDIVFIIFVEFLACLCFKQWPINLVLSVILIGVSILSLGIVIGIHITRFFLPSVC